MVMVGFLASSSRICAHIFPRTGEEYALVYYNLLSLRQTLVEQTMTAYRCTNCNHVLAPGESPCSVCGDTRRTVDMELNATTKPVVSVNMTVTRLREELKKNWPLIAVLVLGDVLSTIPAYFLSGLASVGVTLLFIVFSTAVGYYAITRVIRVTVEHL
jgi:hypothetical protein